MPFETFPPPGSPPGLLEHPTGRETYPSRLRLIWYNADGLEEKVDATLADVEAYKNRPGVKWLHLEGLQDLTLLENLNAILCCFHPLALEDVVEGQAPVKLMIILIISLLLIAWSQIWLNIMMSRSVCFWT
jgi:hypothetical protein